MNALTMPLKAAAHPLDLNASQLDGVVQRLLAFEDDWTILDLDGNRTATGELDAGELSCGVAYKFFGHWEHHPKYGAQFRFDSFVLGERQEQMGIVSYLSRSQLGLTRHWAMKLWNAYGHQAIDWLRTSPDTVAQQTGLDVDKARAAAYQLRDMCADEPTKLALFELFGGRGFPRSTIKDCLAKWGQKAPEVIRRDAFQMLVRDIKGVGFKRADKLFLDLGGNPLRLKRQTLAAWYALHTSSTGNTWDNEGVINQAVLKSAGTCDDALLTRAIQLGTRARWIARRDDGGTIWYAERHNARNEELLAKHIGRVRGHRALWPAIPADAPATEHQRQRLATITGSALGILAGTPGTGKTFTAAVLLQELITQIGAHRIGVCAPTGKAAVRITEAMGRYNLPLQACTVHGLLGVAGYGPHGYQFEHGEGNKLPYDVVVLDECSMLDTDLGAALFAAIRPGGNVLLVGDPYQLPPVGHGAPLRDMIDAGVPCGLLEEIKRNSGAIVTACRDIKDGRPFATSPSVDMDAGDNLLMATADTEADQQSLVVSLLGSCRAQGFNPVWECQVLCATNDKSAVSRKQLNVALQQYLNPVTEQVDEENRNLSFRIGDKVICLKNTQVGRWQLAYEDSDRAIMANWRKTIDTVYLANGDMGRVESVSKTEAVVTFSSPSRTVKIPTGRQKKKDGEGAAEKVEFDLAYAVTVHKSQGSEWPIVIVVIDEAAGPLGSREWVYTAISRAAKCCFLVGKRATALKFARKIGLQKRKTFLRELIQGTK